MLLALIVKLPFLILLAGSLIAGYQLNKLANLAPAKYKEAEIRAAYAEKPMQRINVVLGGKKVSVEVANTLEEQARGLMFRDKLAEDVGMLFDFEDVSAHSMWMRNTTIPLDMVWIGPNFKVVHVEKNVQPCVSITCPSYKSSAPAKYVLELNAGWLDKNNIPPNTFVQIPL